MASSSMTKKYDVFVSFQGDTRLNFRDHLFGAFRRKGISVFRDDTMITKGESLEPELVRAIEGSLVYVVVFSKNFASSTWCLRELEMILKCVRDSRKPVFPVFYDVDPSEVRRQNVGNYAEAFAKHEERFKQDLEVVQNWRGALIQVGSLSGWDMRHKLNLGGNKFVTLSSLEKLSKLEYLNLEHCKCLKSLTMLPSPTTISDDIYWNARGLYIFSCSRLGEKVRCSNMTCSWMIQFIRANQ